MSFRVRKGQFTPRVDPLDPRQLLAGSVSASLTHAVLSVQGTSPSAPIEVDIVPGSAHRAVTGTVIVSGVAQFPAVQVRKIEITGVVGEAITVQAPPHRARIPVLVSNDAPAPAPQPPPDPAPAAAPASAATASDPSQATMSPLEQAVVDLTNQARAQNGLPPLQVNGALVEMAQLQSNNMAQLNEMAHVLPGVAEPTIQSRAAAAGYNYTWLGENIAFNYPDAASVVNAWMNSPEHRANILNPNFTDIGVGFAWNSLGQAYATEDFGSSQ
jgi:uncharacterized protein YkwD